MAQQSGNYYSYCIIINGESEYSVKIQKIWIKKKAVIILKFKPCGFTSK